MVHSSNDAQRRLVRRRCTTGDQEAFERLSRLSDMSYDDVPHRVAYGTPPWWSASGISREILGITGVAGRKPRWTAAYERVALLRLLTE